MGFTNAHYDVEPDQVCGADKMDLNENKIQKKAGKIVLPLIVVLVIIAVVCVYTYMQRINLNRNVEQVTNQMAEYIANNIANEIDYAKSSIKLSSLTISQSMTSEEIDNPSELIMPMIENTPFGGIEYIRADGMNVMNIGEPFDASDRVYYKEGIKGNTGVWNNFHPKTSKETLVNFYTPLIYEGKTAGVITGYIAADTQLVPLFEKQLYGKPIQGIILDENNMVICSTMESEYVPDLTLEMFMERFNVTGEQKQRMYKVLSQAGDAAVSYKDPDGEGRICMVSVPDTEWNVAIIIPAASFNEIVIENARDLLLAVVVISLILIAYAAYILLRNIKRRRQIAAQNVELEAENMRAFNEISRIRDIIASANMGTWSIELVEGKEPCMYVDDTMKGLLGIADKERTPEQTYADWFSNIKPEAVQSVLDSVAKMEQGSFDENTYLWLHPAKGERYVRCGGTAKKIPGGFSLQGYHYDVDDVVREDQAKVVMLKKTLADKNEYYSTLETLGDVFYSMHVINLKEDTAVEFNAKNEVKEIVNHRDGAAEMMVEVMTATTSEEYRDRALEFTDLTTLSDRMKDRKILSQQFVGIHTGWFLASFITMDKDDEGRPTKVIYTTRVIEEEKKYEERLIKKSQTDELTGLLNRRAYEEDIYEHNDTPDTDEFTYISLDVNGLKVINDTKGHMAGDELIIGACQCMKKSFAPYGKLYRIGGDEFVAILSCEADRVSDVLKDFDDTVAGFKGKLVDGVSISYGWIHVSEEPEFSVRQLGAVAEQRMYESKDAYYKHEGFDRRGQKDAHKALCELYTKILKINITNDTYQIVNMDSGEQVKEMGFSDKISEWLENFGKMGLVHPDDLSEYLKTTNIHYMRDYFEGNKTSLHVFYRRRFGDDYKQVMMELIPANDYKNDSQSLFLYVKNIDR